MFRLFSEGWIKSSTGDDVAGRESIPIVGPGESVTPKSASESTKKESTKESNRERIATEPSPSVSDPTMSPSPQRLLDNVRLPDWLRTLPETAASNLVDHLHIHAPRLVEQLTAVAGTLYPTLGKESTRLAEVILFLRPVPLQQLAFAIAVVDYLTEELDLEWQQRSRTRALVAGMTAHVWRRRTTPQSTNSPFALALLRSVGMTIMLHELGDSYRQFLDAVSAQRANQRRLESLTLGFDHLDLTERMFDAWRLHEFYHDHDAHRPAVVLAEHASEALIDHQSHSLDEFLAHSRKEQVDATQLQVMMSTIDQQVQEAAHRLQWPLAVRPMLGQSLTMLLTQRGALVRISSPLHRSPTSNSPATSCAATSAAGNNSTAIGSTAEAKSCEDDDRPPESLRIVPNPASGFDGEEAGCQNSSPQDSAAKLIEKTSQCTVRCRHQRETLSLTLLEVDGLASWCSDDSYEMGAWTQRLIAVVQELGDARFELVVLEPGRLALLQPGQDRGASVALAKQVLQGMCRRAVGSPGSGISLSAGIASMGVPPKNFAPEDLIHAARRCLSAAQASGGGSLKSIDIL